MATSAFRYFANNALSGKVNTAKAAVQANPPGAAQLLYSEAAHDDRYFGTAAPPYLQPWASGEEARLTFQADDYSSMFVYETDAAGLITQKVAVSGFVSMSDTQLGQEAYGVSVPLTPAANGGQVWISETDYALGDELTDWLFQSEPLMLYGLSGTPDVRNLVRVDFAPGGAPAPAQGFFGAFSTYSGSLTLTAADNTIRLGSGALVLGAGAAEYIKAYNVAVTNDPGGNAGNEKVYDVQSVAVDGNALVITVAAGQIGTDSTGSGDAEMFVGEQPARFYMEARLRPDISEYSAVSVRIEDGTTVITQAKQTKRDELYSVKPVPAYMIDLFQRLMGSGFRQMEGLRATLGDLDADRTEESALFTFTATLAYDEAYYPLTVR